MDDFSIQPPTDEPHDAISETTNRNDLILWFAMCFISTLSLTVIRWPTFMGIEALPWLHQGNEFPWRVWWRARDQFLNSSHPVLLYSVLAIALTIVFLGTSLVCWLLLIQSKAEQSQTSENEC